MFEETKLFGFSMAPQTNRRKLVLITYAAAFLSMLGMFLLVLALRPRYGHARWILGLALANPIFLTWWLLLLVISRRVFGRLVRSAFRWFLGPPMRPVQSGLGLAPTAPEDEPPNDEREIAVRDHAYYLAYRGLVSVAFVVLPFWLLCMTASSPAVAFAGTLAMFVFLIAGVTLPQAVILWTEPDLTGEEEIHERIGPAGDRVIG